MDHDHLYKPPFDRRLHMKFEENWPRGFREKLFKCVDGWKDDGRTTDGK